MSSQRSYPSPAAPAVPAADAGCQHGRQGHRQPAELWQMKGQQACGQCTWCAHTHSASWDKWLCLSTFVSQYLHFAWGTEHWWPITGQCTVLTLSIIAQCIKFEYEKASVKPLQITPLPLEAWNCRNGKSFPDISLHSVYFNDSISWTPYGPSNKIKINGLQLNAVGFLC